VQQIDSVHGTIKLAGSLRNVDFRHFCKALMTRRLAVPSTGFFEWKHTEGKKQKEKFWIRLQDAPMLYMAGIYTLFRLPDGNEEARFVILTTAANESMGAYTTECR